MKNKYLLVIFVCVLLIGLIFAVGCAGQTPPAADKGGTDVDPDPIDPSKEVFTGITFESLTVTYDGDEHILAEAQGVPNFATVTYTGRAAQIDAGVYSAKAKITADGYNDLTLNATLTINKATFSGITLEDFECTYDGDPHTITIAGALPTGTSVTYSSDKTAVSNTATNAGTYNVTATITNKNYNTLALNAVLKINKATLTGITFDGDTFDYDGANHSIFITGVIPTTATVVYISDVDNITNTASEVGTYNVTATITDANYETLVLNAVLKINVENKQRLLAVSGDTLFFDNAMDKDYFYVYNFDDEEIMKIESGTPKDIDVTSADNVVYVAGASFLSSIKTASYDNSVNPISLTHNSLINENAQYIQYGGGDVYYYVINGLTNDKSGIYKIDLTDADNPVKTLLSVGKAKYLKLVGGYLYFADGANGSKLSKINTTDSEQTRTLILNGEDEVKINNLYTDGTRLYFTVNETLGNYISSYTIDSGTFRKLTTDAASEMVVEGDYLYYINIDKLTTTFIGNGIYRVNKNPSGNYNLPGSKVIDDPGEGLTSLAAYDGSLIYYDVDGYKLMVYNISTTSSENILEGFVAPADPKPVTLGGQAVANNGVVYYLDIWDGKTLHMYNPQTSANFRMTADKVKEFTIIGDYIYLNIVTTGVNNNTYRINIKTNDVPELINGVDAVNIVSDGTFIYYIKNNAMGAATEIHRAKMDGTEDIAIYEYAASYMYLYNDSLYFIGKYSGTSSNYVLHIDNVSTLTAPVSRSSSMRVNSSYAGNYLYMDDSGVLYFNNTTGTNSISKMNRDGSGLVKVVDNGNVDVGQIIVAGDYLYYFNRYNSKNDYDAYKVSKNATAGTPEKLTTGMHPYGACILGDEIYFVDYYSAVLGDSHLYSVSVNGGTPELIA